LVRCLVIVCCTCGLVLSASLLTSHPPGSTPSVGFASLQAQTSRTELMQQSDYKQRTERAQKVQTEGNDLATLTVVEPADRDTDYLVLIVLVASLAILAFVAGRRRSARLRL
jgi:hypothetical protein